MNFLGKLLYELTVHIEEFFRMRALNEVVVQTMYE